MAESKDLCELSSTELEIWADIPRFNNFQVSNTGKVRSKQKIWECGNGAIRVMPEYELSYSLAFSGKKRMGPGYKKVVLQQDGKRKNMLIHKLVAEAFIPNLENKPYIDHINRDTLDNCVENLRWCTAKENCQNRGGKYARS